MTCFLDMDGVLVDFYKGWFEHHYGSEHNRESFEPGNYDLMDAMGMDVHQFWEGIGDDFWINLEWMPNGKQILEVVESYFTDICLVTQSPPSAEYTHIGLSGKVQWIAKHLPRYRDRFLIGTGRRFCANMNSFLIDDNDTNINDFNRRGGNGILVPRYWNSLHSIKNPVEYLNETLYRRLK